MVAVAASEHISRLDVSFYELGAHPSSVAGLSSNDFYQRIVTPSSTFFNRNTLSLRGRALFSLRLLATSWLGIGNFAHNFFWSLILAQALK
jgi:hypothetical protein